MFKATPSTTEFSESVVTPLARPVWLEVAHRICMYHTQGRCSCAGIEVPVQVAAHMPVACISLSICMVMRLRLYPLVARRIAFHLGVNLPRAQTDTERM